MLTIHTNNYTVSGRLILHKKLGGYNHLIEHLLKSNFENQSMEFTDNKISLIAGQRGKCYVTNNNLEIGYMECHHKKPKSQGGTDEYKNLVWLCYEAHKLVHCTEQKTIEKYLKQLNLDEKGLKRIDSLRRQVGNLAI